MSIYDKLKKSIQELENDQRNNPIEWVAKFNNKDEEDGRLVKVGIRKEGNLTWIYFDFSSSADLCEDSEEKAIATIDRNWGSMETFEWLK